MGRGGHLQAALCDLSRFAGKLFGRPGGKPEKKVMLNMGVNISGYIIDATPALC